MVFILQDDKIAEIYSGVSGYKLGKVLHNEFLNKLRIQFWQELKGDTKYLEDFHQRDTNAFLSFTEYAYILGKFESITLPIHKESNLEIEVPMMFISELYTSPEFRKRKIANSFVRDAQFKAKGNQVPLVCGCSRELKTFYEHMGFIPIEPSKTSECLLMVWASNFGYILQGFKNLFESATF